MVFIDAINVAMIAAWVCADGRQVGQYSKMSGGGIAVAEPWHAAARRIGQGD
jgi:hypothetical protein